MFVSWIYVLLAILGLSFLIFIHELGHYWMARRVGMRVETFSIGFGKPIISWMHDGVKWQIGWLLFGGYVKIAGMDKEGDSSISPYDIPDGFYGKTPWQRIKVAFMGPFTNLVFAFLLFVFLWSIGGRDKNFSEVTSIIGWVDPKSALFVDGLRPGDQVESYDGRSFTGVKDHFYAAITASNDVAIDGFKAPQDSAERIPFEIKAKPYPNPHVFKKNVSTLGIMSPASYLIYDRMPNNAENPLPEGSPLLNSGIQYGDRLVWIDGEPIYSMTELETLLNDERALLTILRNNKLMLARVPRVPVGELRLDAGFKEELIDWQFEANLKSSKLQKLYAIPYNLSADGVVENPIKFIDAENQLAAFPTHYLSKMEEPLQIGDKIVAVDGVSTERAYQIFKQLQTRSVNLIVQRNPAVLQKTSWKQADADFYRHSDWDGLDKIARSIGTVGGVRSEGDFHLLNPVTPKKMTEFERSPEQEALLVANLMQKQKEIDSIDDPEKRAHSQQQLNQIENRLMLGLPLQDVRVNYNPAPVEQFWSVVEEIWRTLGSLITGALSFEWLSGPVGIVQVVQENWMISVKEALFWIGAISINLGILNLLPIPVLDGGTIVLSLVEMITRRRINPKVLEWLVLPFAALLILFFLYVTYHDLSRIFTR